MINCIEDLQELVRNGETDFPQYGRVRSFEQDGMVAFDYTPEAEYEGVWNAFERMSRGLVLDKTTGEILARPYDKFFNLGQHGAYPKTKIKYFLEKADGSLGIIFRDQHEDVRVNTRGSFQSEQAVWATNYCYANDIEPPSGCTLLAEIIYPENRIVVDYGEGEVLIVHAVRDNTTGDYWSYEAIQEYYADEFLCGSLTLALRFEFDNLDACVAYVNSISGVKLEGVVVITEDGERFKIKGEDYLRLHRLVTNITPKNVWELLKAGGYETYRKEVPDEFLKEFDKYAQDILGQVAVWMDSTEELYESTPQEIKEGSQKDFALWVKKQPAFYHPYLFQLHKGIDISKNFLDNWKTLTGYKGA